MGPAAAADPTYMTQLFSQQPGPLPLTTTYESQGGSLMFILSGSAWSTINWITLGVNLSIDGTVIGSAKASINEPYSHHTVVSNGIVLQNLPAGKHVIKLTPYTTTGEQTDTNDYYDLTVIEVVPATT
jgi:hypothetical protein